MNMSRVAVVLSLAVGLLTSPAWAQSSGTWNGLPDRFQIDAGYFDLKADTALRYNEEASVTDWRLAADYYVFRGAGLGVQYKYNKYTQARGILDSKLGGEMTFQGVQAFSSFRF
jgi:hypothetical protein